MAFHGRPANEITNLEDILSQGIKQIRRYIHAMHELIKEDGEKYKKQFNGKHVWSEEEEHQFWEAVENLEQSGNFNPCFFNKSSLIIIFSFFEKLFKDLINAIIKVKQFRMKINDLSGSDIERCYNYLKLVVEYDLSQHNKEWIILMEYQIIRNLYVHNLGEIPDDKKEKIMAIISASKYLVLSQEKNEVLINDEEYLNDLCNIIETFLGKIAKDLR